MTFQQWVMKNTDVDSRLLARRAIKACPTTVLVEVIRREIEHVRRVAVRPQEANVRAFFEAVTSAGADSADMRGAMTPVDFSSLLHLSFALGDGSRVTWGGASIAQHEERITMLRMMTKGLEETIRRHEHAVKVLRDAGADKLEELRTADVA